MYRRQKAGGKDDPTVTSPPGPPKQAHSGSAESELPRSQISPGSGHLREQSSQEIGPHNSRAGTGTHLDQKGAHGCPGTVEDRGCGKT